MKTRKISFLLKTVTAMTLCLSSVGSFGVTAFAEEIKDTRITYDSDEMTFTKISHPTKSTGTADGIVDYLGNGVVGLPGTTEDADNQGDRGQNYSWSALAYGDYLYVGTCYSAMGNTLSLMKSTLGDTFDEETMKATLNAMFNGTFFYGQEDGKDSRGILVKINTKTGDMKLIMSESSNGVAPLFRNGVVYNGKLYFCGSVRDHGSSGLPSVYEIDPETDEYKAVYVGLKSMKDYGAAYKQGISTGIRGIAVYNNKLVISNVYYDSTTGTSGANILISDNPSEGQSSFKEIANSNTLFNYPAYRYQDSIYGGSVWDMTEYNGNLYVSICTGTPENAPDDNSMQSFALVRGVENEDGTFSWTPIVGDQTKDGAKYTFGIDPSRTRSGAANLIVFNDYLYIGEYNDEEIALERILFNKTGEKSSISSVMNGLDFSFVNANLEQSVNLYRMNKNEDIQLVVGDNTDMFTSLSGIGSGFGHNENQYIWRMTVYNGKLYVGTFDTSSLLEPVGQFSNGDIIRNTPEQWQTQIEYLYELFQKLYISNHDYNPQPASLSDETNDETNINDVDDSETDSDLMNFLYDLNDTSEMLEDGSILTTSEDVNESTTVTHTLDYYTSFEEKYSALLDTYNSLDEKYQFSDEVKENVAQILDQDSLKRIQSVITCLTYMSKATRGFDLYVSDDGINFTTITTDGFGDPYNHGLRTFAETTQGLCIGTANPFYGTQVWMTESNKKVVDKPTAIEGLVYNGKELTGVESNDGYTVTGGTAIEPGTYTATVTLNDGYIWADADTNSITITWSIAKPTPTPTVEPTTEPTVEPTDSPTPTVEPTSEPTVAPTTEPTTTPTVEPTVEPTSEPTATPDSTVVPVTPSDNSSNGGNGSNTQNNTTVVNRTTTTTTRNRARTNTNTNATTTTTVDDSNTPTSTPSATAEATATPSSTSTPTVISDDETPKAASKGHWGIANLALGLLSVVIAVIMLMMKNDEEDKTTLICKVVASVAALASIITFVLTQQFAQSMVFADAWTILMAIYAICSIATICIKKFYLEDNDTSEE